MHENTNLEKKGEISFSKKSQVVKVTFLSEASRKGGGYWVGFRNRL